MVAGVMTLGTVRTTEIGQPAAKLLSAVLITAYGEGPETKWRWAGGACITGIRYSPALPRGSHEMKGLTSPELRGPGAHSTRRINRTTGITGLWQPSVHSDVAF